MKRLAAVALSIWLGVQVGFGYVAAPILFKTLEKSTAGVLAGQLFHISNYIGMAAWVLAWAAIKQRSAWDNGVRNRYLSHFIAVLLILFALNEWAVSSVIADLKAGQIPMLARWFGESFGMWHGISTVLHILQTLLGLGLVIKLLRLQN